MVITVSEQPQETSTLISIQGEGVTGQEESPSLAHSPTAWVAGQCLPVRWHQSELRVTLLTQHMLDSLLESLVLVFCRVSTEGFSVGYI